jgi:hypothetical protein
MNRYGVHLTCAESHIKQTSRIIVRLNSKPFTWVHHNFSIEKYRVLLEITGMFIFGTFRKLEIKSS